MKSLLPPELQRHWSIRDHVSRSERFKELAFAGYRIPRCGLFKDMKRLNVPLVVYTDPHAHCGEGKRLWKPGEAEPFGFEFCSEYINHETCFKSFTRRKLYVGRYEIHLNYTSHSSWMSNVDGEYEFYTGPFSWPAIRNHLSMTYPMFAIDFVRMSDMDDFDIAVDLNTCPGVPVEVVNLVGRDKLTESVREVAIEFGYIGGEK